MAERIRHYGDPWHYARKAKRAYITPEDVTEAIKGGGTEVKILRAVLAAIERRAVEDVSLTAFVALKVKTRKSTQRQGKAQ